MSSKFNSPLPVDLIEGQNYSWCSCGQSQSMPLCDGTHQESDNKPVTFTAEETKTLFLCACTKTDAPPFCDGSHCND